MLSLIVILILIVIVNSYYLLNITFKNKFLWLIKLILIVLGTDYRNTVVMEFKKAFDKVPHLMLLQKFQEIPGINEYLLNWILDFLSDSSLLYSEGQTLKSAE